MTNILDIERRVDDLEVSLGPMGSPVRVGNQESGLKIGGYGGMPLFEPPSKFSLEADESVWVDRFYADSEVKVAPEKPSTVHPMARKMMEGNY